MLTFNYFNVEIIMIQPIISVKFIPEWIFFFLQKPFFRFYDVFEVHCPNKLLDVYMNQIYSVFAFISRPFIFFRTFLLQKAAFWKSWKELLNNLNGMLRCSLYTKTICFCILRKKLHRPKLTPMRYVCHIIAKVDNIVHKYIYTAYYV